MRLKLCLLICAGGICSACGLLLAGTLAGGESGRAQADRNQGAFQWYAENVETLKVAERDIRCDNDAAAFRVFLAQARSENEERFGYKSPIVMSEFAKKLNTEVEEWRSRCAVKTAEASSHSIMQSPIAPSYPSRALRPAAEPVQRVPSGSEVLGPSVGGAANAPATASTSD
jgi:hypothetical protein